MSQVKCSRQQWFFSSSFSGILFQDVNLQENFLIFQLKVLDLYGLGILYFQKITLVFTIWFPAWLCGFGKSELTIYTDHLIHICVDIFPLLLGSPPAIERLSSGLFQEVIVTNTIPVAEKNHFPQLTVLSVANLLGETIWRVHDDCSVSSIFQ